jgi:hypothetical protein
MESRIKIVRATWLQALDEICPVISFLESGGMIHPGGKDHAKASTEFLEQLRRDRALYLGLLSQLPAAS